MKGRALLVTAVDQQLVDGRMRAVLIDGNNLLYHCFYKNQTSVVPTFLSKLHHLVQSNAASHVLVAFDSSENPPTVRKRREQKYKSHYKPTPDALRPIFQICTETLLQSPQINVIRPPPVGYEADDVLSSYAKRLAYPSIIVSDDVDFFQLIQHDRIHVYRPSQKRYVKERHILSRFQGLTSPSQLPDFFALQGKKLADPIFTTEQAMDILKKYQSVPTFLQSLDHEEDLTIRAIGKRFISRIELAYALNQLKTDLPIDDLVSYSQGDQPG